MDKWQEFITQTGNSRIKQNDQAKLFIEIENINELIAITKLARRHNLPVYVVGMGSWPHIPDSQIQGLVIKNNCRRFDVFAMSGKIKDRQVGVNSKLIYAQSGTVMNQLVRFTIEEGLSGLEYHLGMPGSVGGAIYTNAKFAPKSIYVNDFVESITILDRENEIVQVGGDYFSGKSTSVFAESGDIILSVVFRLYPDDKKLLWEKANEAALYRNKKE